MQVAEQGKIQAAKFQAELLSILQAQPDLEFAVLVGSHATGSARADSDWDIALQWSARLDWLTQLSNTETLRLKLRLIFCLSLVSPSHLQKVLSVLPVPLC